MCGIVGFTRTADRPVAADETILRAMLAPIAHRGPDAAGGHVAGRIALGHLRLAIVDLEGGQQPRVDPLTGDALVFNGEIYGYRRLGAELEAAGVTLADRSDTEVLFRALQHYGVARAVEIVDGMFAFAYFEGATRRLHLVRDRFGEKPLYYSARGGHLIFGSEPCAVLAHPDVQDLPIDPAAVATFVDFEYLPGPRTLRQDLLKLAAGHRLVREPDGGTSIHCYWRPDPDEAGRDHAGRREEERVEHLDAILDEAVRERLIADVPVGVFLSGGIDSSLIAAYVARYAPRLTAFTASMSDATYDETPAARTLAEALGLRHEIVAIDQAAILDAFDTITKRMDEPLADASLLSTLALCRAARRHMTVALGGDGADELFAGYISFKANRAARLLAALPAACGRALRLALSAFPHDTSYMSPDFLLRQLSHGFGVAPTHQWVRCMAPFAPEEAGDLWHPEMRAAVLAATDDPIARLLQSRRTGWSTADLIYLFATTYLPEDILHKVDRASMYVSLEVRAPYLGRRFAEFVMSLPSDDKIRGLTTKFLFRKLAERHVPPEIVARRKHGFAIPLAEMLRGPLREPVAAALLDASSPLSTWFRREAIERLWAEHQSARRDHRKKLWTLFTLAVAARNTNGPSFRSRQGPALNEPNGAQAGPSAGAPAR